MMSTIFFHTALFGDVKSAVRHRMANDKPSRVLKIFFSSMSSVSTTVNASGNAVVRVDFMTSTFCLNLL